MTWVRKQADEPPLHGCELPEIVGDVWVGDVWRCDDCGALWRVGAECKRCDSAGALVLHGGEHRSGREWRRTTRRWVKNRYEMAIEPHGGFRPESMPEMFSAPPAPDAPDRSGGRTAP